MLDFRLFVESEEEGFLRALRQNLKDNGAWLVYADWLEEHGNENAGTIRILVAMDEALRQNTVKFYDLLERLIGPDQIRFDGGSVLGDLMYANDAARMFLNSHIKLKNAIQRRGMLKRFPNGTRPAYYLGKYIDEQGNEYNAFGGRQTSYVRLEGKNPRPRFVYDAGGGFQRQFYDSKVVVQNSWKKS